MNRRLRWAYLGVIAAALLVIGWLASRAFQPGAGPTSSSPAAPASSGSASSANGTSVEGLPAAAQEKREVDYHDLQPALATVVVDVHQPAKVRSALKQNPWLQKELGEPMGRGFAGAWAGFLGTKGEDVSASFKGAVIDLLTDKLLGSAYRVVWFAGQDATGAPALVMPSPDGAARDAYAALTAAAGRGTQLARACPGDEAPPPLDAGVEPAPHQFEIQRWVLADQSVYASADKDRLVIGRSPLLVLEALCSELPAAQRTEGADVDVTLDAAALGRDAQMLAALVGAKKTVRLAFALENDTVVPKGLAAELASPGRLDVAALSDDLLRAVPEDTPVLLSMQLKLPEKLDQASLKSFLSAKGAPGGAVRQVALLWVPHGDRRQTSDVALLWSRTSDEAALGDLFSGPNKLLRARQCNQLVLASSQAMLDQVGRACSGKTPSLLQASGPVLAGLRAPSSVGLVLQSGRLLSRLTEEGWRSELPPPPFGKPWDMPPELRAAQKQLEELPALGLFGNANATQLLPRGFRS